MPTLKETTIDASFFPNAGGTEKYVENSGMRDLGGDSDEEDTVVASGPSTRRSSINEKPNKKRDKSAPKAGQKISLIHFHKDDPEDPKNWSKPRKWFITFLLCMMTTLIGLSTSAYSTTIPGMTKEYGVAQVVGQIGMTTFQTACAIAPLILAPLCELIGRREVYLSAYFGFVVVFLLLALGKNIGSQLVGRLLSGLFGSCGTILVGGTLADIWDTYDRSVPMSCFTFCAIFGTIAAPAYCGYIDMYAGWRWIEWVHMIANGVLFIVEVFFLKETRGAKILMDRAKAMRKETGNANIRAPAELESESVRDLLRKSSTRAIMLLVKEPVLLCFGAWIAYAWGITFLFLSAIPLTFQGNHGWSEGNAGLPYFALMLGCFIGFATGLWADSVYDNATRKNNGVPVPEYRLVGAMAFAWTLPAGLLVFSFTQYAFVHWMGPMVALVMIILGIYHIFLAVYNYTSDSYGEMSSSAIAGQGFMRNMFAASFPLFATQMFNGMGYQYAGLLLSLIACLALPLPYVLFKKGAQIRAGSRYASTEISAEPEDKSGKPPKETLQTGTLV